MPLPKITDDPVFVRGSFCARHVASSARGLLGGGRKSICTLQGSRVCSFPGQVGFGAEQGFRATGAISGSQDPLRGMLVAGQVQLVGPLSLLGRSPDPEPRTDDRSSSLERRDVNVVELLRQSSGWVFENSCKATASTVSCGAWGTGRCGMGWLSGPSLVGSTTDSLGWHPLPPGQCRGMGSGPIPETSTRK